ncbi:MAG TPA: alpha/beta hydrolase [Polyangiaceae bacterium]|jgi:alpha-beta hydrolase superfamily lysophospholipase
MTMHEEGTLARAGGGPSLHYYAATPAEPPRVAVGLLHGYAEHGKRYAHVVDALAERGIATVAIDLRGHGLSEGRRGHCDRFPEFLDDAAELTRLVRERFPSVPAVLFGHSFGGLVAASVAIARPSPWRALALSGPFFGVANKVPFAKRLAGRVATRIAPTLAIPTGLGGKDVTHDAERARAYDEDPLVFKTATARWFTETEGAQDQAIARAASLTMPLLVVIGLADHVVSVPRARAFFDAAGSSDKTWDGREGLFHEVLNEVAWRPIADRFAEWILAHA